MRGKYPNRGYPKIFNDPDVGAEAEKLFNEAKKMLSNIVDKKLLKAQAVIGFYPANSVGDDIEVIHMTSISHDHFWHMSDSFDRSTRMKLDQRRLPLSMDLDNKLIM